MKDPAFTRNERGLTLVETLVAVTMLATAISATAMLTGSAYSAADVSRCRAHAMTIANEEIEALRALRYDELAAKGTWGAIRTRDGTLYPVVCSVRRDSPAPNMAEVAVSVSFTGRKGVQSEYVAETILTSIQR